MSLARRSLITLLLIGILSTSCGPEAANSSTPDINQTVDAAAQTMISALFQTQTALAPVATNTPIPTVTSLPTASAPALSVPTTFATLPIVFVPSVTPTGTQYTATPLASSLGAGCNNLRLISSYTEPEGPFLPGDRFVQAWQIENNGTCDWLYGFTFVFVSGDKLGDSTVEQYGDKKAPGGWTTFRITLHAPQTKGTFKSSWQFSNGAGTKFGSILPVNITVNAPTKTPNLAETAAAQQTATQAVLNANATATCEAILTATPNNTTCPP